MATHAMFSQASAFRTSSFAHRRAPIARVSSRNVAVCAAESGNQPAKVLFAGLAAAAVAFSAAPSYAAFRLPPIDTKDPERCMRGYTGNTIGQANAVSDKILDLRLCSFKGGNLSGKTLAGALMSDADMSNTNLQEAVLTKAYAVNANFSGADMTNAVVDRVVFDGADLSGVKFVNAVITGTTFDNANLANTVFEDALIGSEDAKRLCANPTLTGDSRDEVGCRNKVG